MPVRRGPVHLDHTGVRGLMSTRDGKGVVERTLDAHVHAPFGLVLEARDMLPDLAERG